MIAPEYTLADAALSLSMWVYADDTPTWASLVKNWGSSVVGQFHLGLGPDAADTLNVFITDQTTAFNAGTDLDDFPLEEWQHVAFVADPADSTAGADGTVTLYRNGEIVDTQAYSGAFSAAPVNEALGIGVKTNDAGDDAGSPPGYWVGMMDDLGIWSRALSADEIRQIFTGGQQGTPLVGGGAPALQAGDADMDLDFDQLDLVRVQVAAKYLTGQPATWGDGDWDGAPAGVLAARRQVTACSIRRISLPP